MDSTTFERTVACHCAPALLGLKAASLISLSSEDYPRLEALAGQYNAALDGPKFLVLGRCRERTLLMVYRPELMEEALAQPLARELLRQEGYPEAAPLPWLLRRLMDRLEGNGSFPHEIGLFLGYPPEDVLGFLKDPDGTGCKLCGTWKVYHDVEGAKARFHSFDRCRDWLLARLDRGRTLKDILARSAA